MNPKNPTRAVLYTRVSTDEQAEHGTSLAEQLIAGGKKVEQLGAEVVAHYEDAGVSGALYDTRPGIQAALRDLESGRADVLIVYNVSRLSRDGEHQAAIKKRVERAGGRLAFCDLHIDDTPEGGFVFGMMGQFAQYERQVIRERTMNGRRRRAEEGTQPCRTFSPFGYHVVTKKDVLAGLWPGATPGTYLVLEEKARYVREMFTRYAYRGETLRQIARWLTTEGVPAPQGGRGWYPTVVRRILQNPLYRGEARYGRQERLIDESRLARGFKRADHYRIRPESEWVLIAAPALVDNAVWARCQERADENRHLFSGSAKRRHLYTGLMKCPRCGKAMRVEKRAETRVYYICPDSAPSRAVDGRACNPTHYKLAVLNPLIKAALSEAVLRPEAVRAALAACQERERDAPGEEERENIERRLAELDARERAAVQAQIAGLQAGASAAAYAGVFQQIAAERGALVAKHTALGEPKGRHAYDAAKTAREVCEALARVREFLDAPEMTDAEKHAVVAQWVERIIPEEDAVTLYLRPRSGADPGVTVPRVSTRTP